MRLQAFKVVIMKIIVFCVSFKFKLTTFLLQISFYTIEEFFELKHD
jgi:hypothetical protein